MPTNVRPEVQAVLAKMPTEVRELIVSIADGLRPDIAAVEASPMICQNHYDKYLALLTMAVAKSTNNRDAYIMAFALEVAGANHLGVKAALDIVTGANRLDGNGTTH